MRAAILHAPGAPLQLEQRPIPEPGPGEVLIRVAACGVCRTDLHLADGELSAPRLPLVLGHEVVGTVVSGEGLPPGTRIGVAWLGFSCEVCEFCRAGQENLCEQAQFTGRHRDGGFAEYLVAHARFCFRLPDGLTALEAAPLLCAGMIGYRALRLAGEGERLGIYGFGAAGHLLAQVARWQGRRVWAFTRAGDVATQTFARSMGVEWAGGSETAPPTPLDAAIIFAPVGALVPRALAAVRPGGRVVCAGIHMTNIPEFPYELLWRERELRSVANLTRRDGVEFLALATSAGLHPETRPYRLEDANQALADLRGGRLQGAAVLVP